MPTLLEPSIPDLIERLRKKQLAGDEQSVIEAILRVLGKRPELRQALSAKDVSWLEARAGGEVRYAKHDVSGEKRDEAGKWTEGGGKEGSGQEQASEENGGMKKPAGPTPSDHQKQHAAARQQRDAFIRGVAHKFWEGISSQNADTAINMIARGEDPGILLDRANPEQLAKIKEIGKALGDAEEGYFTALEKIGAKKEPWELTKAEAEHAITYGDMGRAVSVGDERTFYRLGGVPKGGHSFNTMTGKHESGVSVYVTPSVGSMAGHVDREWYYGVGEVVGFGGDDEPVVKTKGKWKKYPGHKKVVAQALKDGKRVPPEVLADYPDLKPPSLPSAEQRTKPEDASHYARSWNALKSQGQNVPASDLHAAATALAGTGQAVAWDYVAGAWLATDAEVLRYGRDESKGGVFLAGKWIEAG